MSAPEKGGGSAAAAMNLGDIKNSEFVGLVADLLELNLKALDRTQQVVADHISECGQPASLSRRGSAAGSDSQAGGKPLSTSTSNNRLTARGDTTVPHGPSLRTDYRMAQKAALKAKEAGAGASRAGSAKARRGRDAEWVGTQEGRLRLPAEGRDKDAAPLAATTADAAGKAKTTSTAAVSLLARSAGLHTCAALGSGVRARQSRTHVACRACAGTAGPTGRSLSVSQNKPKVCADNGRVVEVHTIDLMGATAAERTTLYHRVLDTIDIIIKAPGHPSVQEYFSTHRMPRSLLVYKEHMAAPCLAVLSKKMSGLYRRDAVRYVVREVLEALQPLHAAGLAHGFIRPSTVYWDGKHGAVKISVPLLDWATKISTPAWVAREGMYLSPQGLAEARANETPGVVAPLPTPASDVWAVGCLMMELLTGARPWRHLGGLRETARALIERGDAPLALPKGVEGDAGAFMSACFAQDVGERPGVDELLRHPYLQVDVAAMLPEGTVGQPRFVDPLSPTYLAATAAEQQHVGSMNSNGGGVAEVPGMSPQVLPSAAPVATVGFTGVGDPSTPRGGGAAAGPAGMGGDDDGGIPVTRVQTTYADVGVSPVFNASWLSRRAPTPAPLSREALEGAAAPSPTQSAVGAGLRAMSSPALSARKDPAFVDRTVLSGNLSKTLTHTTQPPGSPAGMVPPGSAGMRSMTPTAARLRQGATPSFQQHNTTMQSVTQAHTQTRALTTLSDKVMETEHRLHRFEECLQGMAQRQDATNSILEALTQQTTQLNTHQHQLSLLAQPPAAAAPAPHGQTPLPPAAYPTPVAAYPPPAPQVCYPHPHAGGAYPPPLPHASTYPTSWGPDRYAVTAPIVVTR